MNDNWKAPEFSLKGTTGEQLIWQVFRGNLTFTIFGPKGTGKIAGFGFTTGSKLEPLQWLRNKITELIKNCNTPNWSSHATRQHYEFTEKKTVVDYNIGFTVDEQLIPQIEFRIGGKQYIFQFKKFCDFTEGNDTMPQPTVARLDAQTFLTWLNTEVPFAMAWTREKPNIQGGNNRGGQRGGYSGGNRGGSAPAQAPQPPPDMNPDEDSEIPF